MVRVTIDYCDLHYPEQLHPGELSDALGVNDRWYLIRLGTQECKDELKARPFEEALLFYREKGEESRDFPKLTKRSTNARTGDDINAGPLPCLWCSDVSDGAIKLGVHLRTKHLFASIEQAYGRECPDCGGDFIRLLSHTSRAHGMHAAALFKQVESEGDPKGIVKKRREALAA